MSLPWTCPDVAEIADARPWGELDAYTWSSGDGLGVLPAADAADAGAEEQAGSCWSGCDSLSCEDAYAFEYGHGCGDSTMMVYAGCAGAVGDLTLTFDWEHWRYTTEWHCDPFDYYGAHYAEGAMTWSDGHGWAVQDHRSVSYIRGTEHDLEATVTASWTGHLSDDLPDDSSFAAAWEAQLADSSKDVTTYRVDWTSPDCTFTVTREHDEALGLSTWTVEAARTVTVTELARCEDLLVAEGSADGEPPTRVDASWVPWPGDDADGDLWPADVDCDDADPSVYPCAPDTEADGVDADCDGADGEPVDTGETGQAGDTGHTGAVDTDTAETDGRDTVASDTDSPGPDETDTASTDTSESGAEASETKLDEGGAPCGGCAAAPGGALLLGGLGLLVRRRATPGGEAAPR